MLTYSIATGALALNGRPLGRAPEIYSGHGAGLLNPALQSDADIGPIPVGVWTIGPPIDHPRLGPLAMALSPAEAAQAHGRSGFFIHGDNAALNESGSHGCIVMPRAVREAIIAAKAVRITVTP